MSNHSTIARPYAKAIFNHALDAKQLGAWSVVLQNLVLAVLDPQANDFITNPAVTAELQCELLMVIFTRVHQAKELQVIKNLVFLLAQNKRLLLLPDIFAQYEQLRAEQEKTLLVSVSSFAPLTTDQKQALINSLGQRLQRKITLDMSIDKSLLGGAVIFAGDLVIDGSVRGKLNKLGTALAA